MKKHIVTLSLIIIAIGALIANHHMWLWLTNKTECTCGAIVYPLLTAAIVLFLIGVCKIYELLVEQVEEVCKLKGVNNEK